MQDRLDTRVRQINDRLDTEGCRYRTDYSSQRLKQIQVSLVTGCTDLIKILYRML
jgi:hypothetical protein